MVIPSINEAAFAARKSATASAPMLVAAVCEVALRFTSTAIGTNAKTVSKQKAAIPSARVSSTSEKAVAAPGFFIGGRFSRCRQSHLLGLRRGSLTLD